MLCILCRTLSLSLCVCVCVCVCIFMCVQYVYIFNAYLFLLCYVFVMLCLFVMYAMLFFAYFLRTVACHVTRVSLFRMALCCDVHVTIKHFQFCL